MNNSKCFFRRLRFQPRLISTGGWREWGWKTLGWLLCPNSVSCSLHIQCSTTAFPTQSAGTFTVRFPDGAVRCCPGFAVMPLPTATFPLVLGMLDSVPVQYTERHHTSPINLHQTSNQHTNKPYTNENNIFDKVGLIYVHGTHSDDGSAYQIHVTVVPGCNY